ncbi:MAG TPA: hypothetical protein VJ806_07835 [Luteimonas sp.]|nr:hypothetical protein [Luteimonas sp.]
MMHARSKSIAACLAFCATVAQAATPTLLPPDPARLPPDVRRAIAELDSIVARRDLAALERHIAADAKMSFGGSEPGAAGLREVWEPQRPDTELWSTLAEILRLGGVAEASGAERSWSAPYPSFAGEELYEDPFSAFIVTGTGVALRAAPSSGARVRARVDYAVLNSDCEGTEDWVCVRWEGAPAYVHQSLARSPIDHRLSLNVTGTGWSILFFVAGD